MKDNYVILVDENDNELGIADKIDTHTIKPQLHRAITVLLFNDKNEILITKRSAKKLLWPLFWETTCSTHPLKNESYEDCAERRLKEELEITTKVKIIDRFVYEALEKNGAEKEYCVLLIGKVKQQKINPDKNEIANYKFVALGKLKCDIKKNPGQYTPWLKLALKKLKT